RAVPQRVAAEELDGAFGGPDQAEHHAERRRLAGTVRAEVAEDVAALDGQLDVVDGEKLAVALDEAASRDRRRLAHLERSRAAVSAAAGGSEPARTKATPFRCQPSTVPSCVASSWPVAPLSETVGRLESAPPLCPAAASAARSTTTIAPTPCP